MTSLSCITYVSAMLNLIISLHHYELYRAKRYLGHFTVRISENDDFYTVYCDERPLLNQQTNALNNSVLCTEHRTISFLWFWGVSSFLQHVENSHFSSIDISKWTRLSVAGPIQEHSINYCLQLVVKSASRTSSEHSNNSILRILV